MYKRLFKQPLFVIGALYILIMVLASFVMYFVYGHNIPMSPLLLMGENGDVLGQSPYSPLLVPPLGTDSSGQNYAILLIMGAKYTIGISLLITFIRVFISFFFGYIYGTYFYKFKALVSGLLDSIHYLPLTLITYIILSTVLVARNGTQTFQHSLWARLAFEIVILAVIAFPIVTILIGNELGEINRKEFIGSSKILGGSRLHILRRHIMPHLLPRIIYIGLQQTIQVLTLLVHLGILQLFLGGTIKKFTAIVNGSPQNPVFLSFTSEWSGLIGLYYKTIGNNVWLLLGPLGLLITTIIAFSFMAEGFKNAMSPKSLEKGKGKAIKKSPVKSAANTKDWFQQLQR